MYNKTKIDIFLVFLKKKLPIKKIGKIYHNLVRKNLNETNGIEDVMQVINIQNKYIKINIVIGCFKMGLNDEKLYPILKMVKIINPNKIGSVGNAISISEIKTLKSDKEIDIGVKNTTV